MAEIIQSRYLYEFRVLRRHTRFDQLFMTARWYRADNVPGAGATSTIFDAMQALAGQYAAVVLPNVGDDISYIGYELRSYSGRVLVPADPNKPESKAHWKLVGEAKAARYNPGGLPDQGGVQMAGQEYCPAFVSCGLITRTDVPQRGASPTIRQGPIPEFHQADGLLIAIEQAKYDQIADFFQDSVILPAEGIGMTPVVFTKTEFLTAEELIGDIRQYHYPVIDVRAQTKLGSQGSRKSPASRIGF